MTIPALLRRSVERRPLGEAIVTIEERLTYADLDARTERMARALLAEGAGKGTRVALLAPDGILWLTAFLAASRIGALVVAISTLVMGPELAHILRHSDAQILIGVRKFLRHDYALRLESAFLDLPAHRGGPLYLNDAPYLRSIWLDDAADLGWASSHAELLERRAPGHDLLTNIERQVAPSDEVVIIYTSGSSAAPKAVVHVHRAAALHTQMLAGHFRFVPSDRLMPLLPLFWIGGLTMALEVIGTGATLVYPMSPEPADLVAAIRTLQVNRVNSWGAQLEKLRAALTRHGIDPGTLTGVAPQRTDEGIVIPPDRTANMLGMSESFGPHSSEPLGTLLPEGKRGASGRATSDYERRVVNPATGEILGAGLPGELQLRNGGLMKGYYKMDPDRVFTPDGFFPTGDTVRIDEDGYLYFMGRHGDMLKTAGANVSRLEVEAALRQLPGVAQPVVVGLPDDEAGQIVVAAVVSLEGSSVTEASLQTGLRELLSSYKIPRRIVFITADEIPWTASQKIKLSEVGALIAARLSANVERG